MSLEQPAPSFIPLGDLRVGTICCNIQGKYVRAAGEYATLLKKEDNHSVLVKLPSGELHSFLKDTLVLKGRIGNEEHRNRIIGKAGRNR